MSRNGFCFLLLSGLLFAAIFVTLVAPKPAAAQTILTGKIEGTVDDSSGASLPGVTVTLTSPALLVPQVVKMTDDRGYYEFPALPLGTYSIGYELTGFTKLTREDIVLTAGFTARVDVALQVGAVQQTITVTGETPLIDVSTTRGGGVLSSVTLAEIPNGHTFNDIVALTPGMTPSSSSQAGLIGFGALVGNYNSYGFLGQDKNFMEGVTFHDSEGVDFSMAQEVNTKTYGTTAEAPTGGAQVSILAKSGGNQYHGRVREEYFNQDLDSTNLDSTLISQGVLTGNALLFSSDTVADLGGPVVHDKLWFYGGVRFQRNRRTVTGFCKAPGPGGQYGIGSGCIPGEPTGRNDEATAKLSWQASPKNLFTAFYNRGSSDDYQSFASRFIPQPTTEDMYYVLHHAKVEWQGTLTNNWLVNVFIGKSWYQAQYRDDSIGSPTNQSTLDQTTQIQTGESFDNRSNIRRDPQIPQFDVTTSYTWRNHEIKAGFNVWHHINVFFAPNEPDGNLQLIFKAQTTAPFLAHQPFEVSFKNSPVSAGNENAYDGYFVTDNWRISKKLTANLGLRIDRTHPFTLASTKIQGMYGGSGFYPSVSLGLWTKPGPRVGIAYDIWGSGKTVAKASFGRYNWDYGDTGASVYNLDNQVTTTYKWTDLNHDNLYEPGEVNFATGFVSQSGTTDPIINRKLEEPYTNQISASVEQHVTSTISARVLYVFWKTYDNFATINPLRPYNEYNVPVSVVVPNPNGTVTAGDPTITIYDLNPAYKGATSPTTLLNPFIGSEPVNRPPGREDYANSWEATVSKRQGRLFLEPSFLATKNHLYIVPVVQSPNDLLSGLNQTWTLNFRLKASYDAPHGIQLSVADLVMNGIPGQRTVNFNGSPAYTLGTITVPVDQFGDVHGGLRESLDIRVGKKFSFERFGFEADADILNLLNNNAAWTTSYLTGATTYNIASAIAPPRTTKLTAVFSF